MTFTVTVEVSHDDPAAAHAIALAEKKRVLDMALAHPLETPAALREFLRTEGPLGEAKQSPLV